MSSICKLKMVISMSWSRKYKWKSSIFSGSEESNHHKNLIMTTLLRISAQFKKICSKSFIQLWNGMRLNGAIQVYC